MVTTKANLNIKINKSVKDAAAQILESMGLDHTTAIEMYYRQIITERQLPFQPKSVLSLDEQLREAIRKSKPKKIDVDFDENGNILIDESSPLYDWAVNG